MSETRTQIVRKWEGEGCTFSVGVFRGSLGRPRVALFAHGSDGSASAFLPAGEVTTLPATEDRIWETDDARCGLTFRAFRVDNYRGEDGAHILASVYLGDIWDQLRAEFLPALAEAFAIVERERAIILDTPLQEEAR